MGNFLPILRIRKQGSNRLAHSTKSSLFRKSFRPARPPTAPRDTATAVPKSDLVSWVMNGLAGPGTLTPETSGNGPTPIESGLDRGVGAIPALPEVPHREMACAFVENCEAKPR